MVTPKGQFEKCSFDKFVLEAERDFLLQPPGILAIKLRFELLSEEGNWMEDYVHNYMVRKLGGEEEYETFERNYDFIMICLPSLGASSLSGVYLLQ
mmetsp:Transcript_8708/g.13462  ORF Transcript_8708/g.13462 Transcript_8708/m.13462 type:complete len:96 (+) Transcript_8708:517-804(+)